MTDRDRIQQIGNVACELMEALQPWELQPQKVRSACVRLTMHLAAVPENEKCPVCQDIGWHHDRTRTAAACAIGCMHDLPGCSCEGEPTFCNCPAGADLFERCMSDDGPPPEAFFTVPEGFMSHDEKTRIYNERMGFTSATSDCEADAPSTSLLDHSTLAMEAIGHLQAITETDGDYFGPWVEMDTAKNWLAANAESVNTLTS